MRRRYYWCTTVVVEMVQINCELGLFIKGNAKSLQS